MASRKINPLDIESNRQEYYHPYAHQPTPFEKLQAFFADFGENSWFLVYEGVGWTIDKLWGLTVALLLLPIALLGLLLDFLRQKVNDHVSIFNLSQVLLVSSRPETTSKYLTSNYQAWD